MPKGSHRGSPEESCRFESPGANRETKLGPTTQSYGKQTGLLSARLFGRLQPAMLAEYLLCPLG